MNLESNQCRIFAFPNESKFSNQLLVREIAWVIIKSHSSFFLLFLPCTPPRWTPFLAIKLLVEMHLLEHSLNYSEGKLER